MKLQGITLEHTPKGRLKQVKINAAADSELVEDIIDMIAYESHKEEPTTPLREVLAQLDKKHKIKR